MTTDERGPLGAGDRAPDFELPAADVEGTVALADHRRRGPVLLAMLRGLYCPFCRRQISQLRPTCEALRAAGVGVLGLVIGSPERTRQYFRYFPPCFPVAAAPDRSVHRLYGLGEVVRTPELRQETERLAVLALRETGRSAPAGQAMSVFAATDGFEDTAEDEAEWARPVQTVAYFLIGRDGVIRWSHADPRFVPIPKVEELLPLVQGVS
jgi:peroxiredoxin